MKITTSQLRQIIREEIQKMRLTEASFLDGFKKANAGYDPKKALANWSEEFEKENPEDEADHKEYIKDAEKWIKEMGSKGPKVKVGELVNVFMRSNRKTGVGKIVKAGEMKGNFGFMGKLEPNKIPSWTIECYLDKNTGSKKTLDVKGKTYYFIGVVEYPQHEEGDSETFSKL